MNCQPLCIGLMAIAFSTAVKELAGAACSNVNTAFCRLCASSVCGTGSQPPAINNGLKETADPDLGTTNHGPLFSINAGSSNSPVGTPLVHLGTSDIPLRIGSCNNINTGSGNSPPPLWY